MPHSNPAIHENWLEAIQWVIVGGESGCNARPMNPVWAQSLRDQCEAVGTAFFFKQWGEWVPTSNVGFADSPQAKTQCFETGKVLETQGGPVPLGIEVRRIGKRNAGRLLDGRTWDEFPRSARSIEGQS